MIKHILPEVIYEDHGAFMKGRMITDDTLIKMECFHWMKKKTKGNKRVMALNLDMSKTLKYWNGTLLLKS